MLNKILYSTIRILYRIYHLYIFFRILLYEAIIWVMTYMIKATFSCMLHVSHNVLLITNTDQNISCLCFVCIWNWVVRLNILLGLFTLLITLVSHLCGWLSICSCLHSQSNYCTAQCLHTNKTKINKLKTSLCWQHLALGWGVILIQVVHIKQKQSAGVTAKKNFASSN